MRTKSRKRSDAHWDVDELDEITNEAHDRKADSYCFANL